VETRSALIALTGPPQETRLEIFPMRGEQGPEGMAAGPFACAANAWLGHQSELKG
jgi:hypothetical protein